MGDVIEALGELAGAVLEGVTDMPRWIAGLIAVLVGLILALAIAPTTGAASTLLYWVGIVVAVIGALVAAYDLLAGRRAL